MIRTPFSLRAVAVGIASVCAASCGGGGGGSGGSGGGGPDTAATAQSLVVFDTKVAPARIRIVVADAESDPVSVQFTFEGAASGGPVPLVGLAANPVVLSTSPAGTVHELPWNFPAEASLPDDASFSGSVTLSARVGADTIRTVVAGLGNDAPVLTVGSVAPVTHGTTSLPFVLRDSSADPVGVKVEYHVDGEPAAAWRLARPAGLGTTDPTPELAFPGVTAPVGGAGFVFFWDTDFDLPDLDRSVRVRFTATDPVATGIVRETGSFLVDNNASPVATIDGSALLASSDRRNGISIPFAIADEEGDPTRVVFQWRHEGEPFPPIALGDPTALIALLRDPVFRRSSHVCTPYASPAVGAVQPTDPMRVRLAQLLLGEHSATLARGVVGREIEVLRTRPTFAGLAATWPTNPLRAPVAVAAGDDATSAFVLEEVAAGSELVEIDLSTGAVLRTLASMGGVPTALAVAPGSASAFAATDAGGTWRVFEVDLSGGGATLRAERVGAAVPGPLRGIAVAGSKSLVATAADSVVRIEWDAVTSTTVLRSGLAEPFGIALDPTAPWRAFVAERSGSRVGVLDLVTRTMQPLGACNAVGLLPSALAVSPDGQRLGVLLRTPGVSASAFLGIVELGRGAQSNVSVPADSGSVCLGADRLALVAQKLSRNLQARLGVEQRRRIVAFDPATAIATVDAAFAPLLGVRQTWRLRALDPALDPVTSSPGGAPGEFVWDSGDAPAGVGIRVRAIPVDGAVGAPVETGAAFVTAVQLDASPIPLATLGPKALTAADVDGDGDLDLIAVSATANALSLFRQIAPGTFAPPLLLGGVGAVVAPKDVEAVDADGDGDVDLIVAAQNGLLLFVQTSPTTFAPPVRIDPSNAPASTRVAAADLDGDGDVDVVAVQGDDAAVFCQTSPGVFAAPVPLPAASVVSGAVATDVAVVDFDHDGRLDVAVSHRGAGAAANGVLVFTQNAAHTFGAPMTITSPRAVTALRVVPGSQGGAAELVAVESDAAGGELASFGAGPSPRAVVSAPGSLVGPADVVASDLDGDGISELLCADPAANRIAVLRRGASGLFEMAYALGGPGVTDGASAVVAADIDADGRVDVACANETAGTIAVVLDARGRHFGAAAVPVGSAGATPSVRDVAVGDMDGDGRLDVVALVGSTTRHLAVFTSGADGAIPAAASLAVPLAGGDACAVGDLDRDGDADAVVVGAADGVQLVRRTGTGSFVTGPLVGTGAGPWNSPTAVSIGDLDSDGDDDVAVVEPNAIAVSLQLANGAFSTPTRLAFAGAPLAPQVAPVLADIDADGDNDVVALAGNTVVIWRQLALGSFAAAMTVTVPGIGNTPRAVAVADFDGDGLLDVATANTLDVTVFRQAAPGSFALAAVVTGGSSEALVAADFDGDGDRDLACVRNGQVVLLPQAAPLVFGPARPIGVATATRLLVADVDGDGDIDVVFCEPASSVAKVLFGGR
ncbi:MAG: VCBS repeat-containing protein [Planctomycetes bacterium]|nr:VCBS repeat-containing protein [Planctomycetota bacterium]